MAEQEPANEVHRSGSIAFQYRLNSPYQSAAHKGEFVSVTCEACIDAVFMTKSSDQSVQRPPIATHDGRSAMSKDGMTNTGPFAPAKLNRDWGVTDQCSVFVAHH